ncbi:MAG TPA: MFS transporter [Candidatus Limnocylindria bacterium]
MTSTLTSYVPRGTRLLLLSAFLSTVPLGYLIVVVPLYLARIGLEATLIGAMFSVSGAVAAVLVAVSGLFADRWGRRRFLLVGTVLPAASYAIFAATTDVPWLFAASLLGGVGIANGAAGALTIATYDALLADHTTEATRTRVFAASGAIWTTAVAAGSICAGMPELIARSFPGLDLLATYRLPYLAMIVLTVTAGVALIPIQDDPEVRAARQASGWWPTRSRRPIAVYSVAIGLTGFGLGIAVQLLPLWYRIRFGVNEADLGPWYAAGQVASFATVALIPYLERRLGAPLSILGAFTGAAVALALIVVAPTFPIAATFHVVRSFLTNLAWPFHQSLLMTSTAPEERATAVGTGFAIWGATNAIGPLAAGALLAAGLFSVPLLVGALMYVLGGLVFGIGFRRWVLVPARGTDGRP